MGIETPLSFQLSGGPLHGWQPSHGSLNSTSNGSQGQSFSASRFLATILEAGPAGRQQLDARIPPRIQQQIHSLSHENDPELFFEGLVFLGRKLANEHNPELGALILGSVVRALGQDFPGRPTNFRELAQRAQEQLDAMMGRGPAGLRLEYLGRNLAREAANPIALASMGLAGLTYNGLRYFALNRLFAAAPGMLTRGFGARALAATFAFAGEVPAFVFSGHGLQMALGAHSSQQDSNLLHELGTAALMLSALKLSGAGANAALARIQGTSAALASAEGSVFLGFSQRALPQFAMLTGIFAGNRMAEIFGLRPHQENGTELTDALSTLIQFNIAGHLVEQAMGPGYARLNRELQLRSEMVSRSEERSSNDDPLPPLAQWIRSLGNHSRAFISGDPRLLRPFRGLRPYMMSENKGGESGAPTVPQDPAFAETIPAGPPVPEPGVPPPVPSETPASEVPTFVRPIPAPRLPQGLEEEGTKVFQAAEGQAVPSPEPPPYAPPSAPHWAAGVRLGPNGRYELVGRLGGGGMGDVWEASDTLLGRQAVIKVPKVGLYDPTSLVRFRRETVISANLDERYVVPLYDQVEIQDGLYVPVMKYVAGRDLSSIRASLDREATEVVRNFPPEKRLEIFAKICEAMESVHNHGVSHYDLKPDNIRVTAEGNVLLMDFGLAKRVGEGSEEVRRSIQPRAREQMEKGLTQAGALRGTPGYIAPETAKPEPPQNHRSPDIFALGVILYEWMTGNHPFAKYRAGDPGLGETAKVPVYVQKTYTDAHGRQQPYMQIDINPYSTLLWAHDSAGVEPPSFREVTFETQPDFYYELEAVARRAFAPDPADRYASARELRQAALMARAEAEVKHLERIRREMTVNKERMDEAWSQFNVGMKINPQQWADMNDPIHQLRGLRESWRQGSEDLVNYLTGIRQGESWPEAQRLIATLSWEKLLEGGDRMEVAVRNALRRRIRENDVALTGTPDLRMSEALDAGIPIEIQGREMHTGTSVAPEAISLTIFPFGPERDASGNEMQTYRTGRPVASGNLAEIQSQIRLPAGYYVFEFQHPEYAPMRVPVILGLEDIRQSLLSQNEFRLPVEFIPRNRVAGEDKVPSGMAIVSGGEATLGVDFFHDALPLDVYGTPQRKVYVPTFAVSQDPVTVAEYKLFIEDLLSQERIEEAREFIPRAKINPKGNSPSLMAEFMRIRREEGLKEAFHQLNSSFTGKVYFWTIRAQGRGKARKYILENPYTDLNDPHSNRDPQGDPILPTQPTTSISGKAARAYLQWRSKRDGVQYRMIRREENEKLIRGGLPLTYPWGYHFNPNFVNSRLAFENDSERYPQPVGTGPLGPDKYRDFTLYGTRDNLGNAREFVDEPVANFIGFSGGSVSTPYGPYYRPSAMAYLQEFEVALNDGAFRLIQDFPPPHE